MGAGRPVTRLVCYMYASSFAARAFRGLKQPVAQPPAWKHRHRRMRTSRTRKRRQHWLERNRLCIKVGVIFCRFPLGGDLGERSRDGCQKGKVASFAVPRDHPIRRPLVPSLQIRPPRDPGAVGPPESVGSHRAMQIAPARQHPSCGSAFRCEGAIGASESGENRCNLHSVARRG